MIKTVFKCDLCGKETEIIKYQEERVVIIESYNKCTELKTRLEICTSCYSKIENAVEIIKQGAHNANNPKQTKTDLF